MGDGPVLPDDQAGGKAEGGVLRIGRGVVLMNGPVLVAGGPVFLMNGAGRLGDGQVLVSNAAACRTMEPCRRAERRCC